MLGIVRVGYDQVSESISWVKVISKWLKISSEGYLASRGFQSYILLVVDSEY